MSDKPVIKVIGIGDVGKRCIERGSSESIGVAHLLLDRDASKDMINDAVRGVEMLWILADASDSNLVAEIGRAASDALTIALLKGTPDPELESAVDAYAFADSEDGFAEACAEAAAISGLVVAPGNVNVNIDDVKYIFRHAGKVVIAAGEGKDAADAASSALHSIDPHKKHTPVERVLFRIDSGPDIGILDIQKASEIIHDASSTDAMMLWGQVADPELHGRVKLVIAVGFKPIH